MNITFRFIWHQGELSEEREVIAEQTEDETPFSPMDVANLTAAVFIGMDEAISSEMDRFEEKGKQ